MRKSVGCFCLVCGVVWCFATNAWAQTPEFSVWVTEVYEQVDPYTWISKCGGDCPTQNLPAGVAGVGDILHVVVTVEDWDDEPDRGICDLPTEECSVSAQDCQNKHCRNTGSFCRFDSDCGPGDSCVDDECYPTPLVGTYQWKVDSSGYRNAGYAGLEPATIQCEEDENCWCYYDSLCFAGAEFGRCTCSQAVCDELSGTCGLDAVVYVDEAKPEPRGFIFLTIADLAIVDYSTLDYTVGATILSYPGVEEGDSSPYYLGTLLLRVTENACGTFEVGLWNTVGPTGTPQDTYLIDDEGRRMPSSTVHSLTVNFPALVCPEGCEGVCPECLVDWCNPCEGACECVYDNGAACDDGNPCTVDDTCLNGVCDGVPKECPPGQVCDPATGECVPDASWADLLGVEPPNCAIDARQPHAIDDPNEKYGWNELVLHFSKNPIGMNLQPGDFEVQVVPFGIAPFISDVVTDGTAQTVTVVLNPAIATLHWTCVSSIESGDQWCMGYVPADASQNQLSNATDIEALIDSINEIEVLPDYATDINRSGATTAQDILREIDLLNGASAFSSWMGARLMEACPSEG